MYKLNKFGFVLISCLIAAPAIAQNHTLISGWNLEGNDGAAAVDPITVFGNATTPTSLSPSVTTVWTWDKSAAKWNFFAPSMTPTALSTYAASKGYGVLTTIQKGQGFWVNAASNITMNLAANPIVGSWSNPVGADVTGTSLVLTFFANGDYMLAQSTVVGTSTATVQQLQVWPGLEHGAYTWNSSTGAFVTACPTVDTNGTAGTSGGYSGGFTSYGGSPIGTCPGTSANVTVSGNTMTLGNITFSRVVDAANPIVGSWSNPVGADVTGTSLVLTFFANGDYMLAQSTVVGTSTATVQQLQVWPGLEHGAYTWNSSTGAFVTACPTVDTNGTAGTSGGYSGGFTSYGGSPIGTCPGTSANVTVSSNTMTLGNITFSRVTP